MTTSSSSWRPRVGFGPALTMAGVVTISLSAVLYSHCAQIRDRNEMKAGVERDKERLRRIKKERRAIAQEAQQQQQQQSSAQAKTPSQDETAPSSSS
jgi:PET assembly of cytochrome c oxidase, mitochondrial